MILKRLKNILKIQDNLGASFNYSIRGERKLHSWFGILISLFINAFCVVLFFISFLQIIRHEKPSVNYMKTYTSNVSFITLNTEQLLFAAAFRNKFYEIINDPTIGELLAYYEKTVSVEGKFENSLTPLKFMNCSNVKKYFIRYGLEKEFDSVGLINYSCFTNEENNVVIGGKYGSDFYGDMIIKIKKCVNNSKSDLICKPKEVIDEVIQNGWLQISHVTAYVDYYNYSHPIQFTTDGFYTQIDTGLNKMAYLYYNPLIMNTENSIILPNQHSQMIYKFDKSETDINFALESDGIVYTIFVCSSLTVEEYFRAYKKLQDLGGSIAGLWYGLSLIGMILMSYFKNKKVDFTLAEELFIFISNQKQLKKVESFFIEQKDRQNVFQKSGIRGSEKNNLNNREKQKIIKETKNNKEKNIIKPHSISESSVIKQKEFSNLSLLEQKEVYKIKYKFCNFIYILFCKCTKKSKKLIKEYESICYELKSYVDLVEVSKHLMDIEKIKGIIINQKLAPPWNFENKEIYINSRKNNKDKIKNKNQYLTLLSKNNINKQNNGNNNQKKYNNLSGFSSNIVSYLDKKENRIKNKKFQKLEKLKNNFSSLGLIKNESINESNFINHLNENENINYNYIYQNIVKDIFNKNNEEDHIFIPSFNNKNNEVKNYLDESKRNISTFSEMKNNYLRLNNKKEQKLNKTERKKLIHVVNPENEEKNQ